MSFFLLACFSLFDPNKEAPKCLELIFSRALIEQRVFSTRRRKVEQKKSEGSRLVGLFAFPDCAFAQRMRETRFENL